MCPCTVVAPWMLVNSGSADQKTVAPTHVLHGSQALPVNKISIENHQTINGHSEAVNVLALSIADLPENLGNIATENDGVYFDSGDLSYLLNGVATSGARKLAVGDRIQFSGSNDVLTLIRVRDV